MRLSNQARWRTLALATVIMITPLTSSIADEARSFDVEAGRAAKTLKLFAKQAQLGIVFDSRSLKDVYTESVVGLMIPSDALARMLEKTSLVFDQDDETGAFAVTRSEVLEEDRSSISASGSVQIKRVENSLGSRDMDNEPNNPTPMNENKKEIGSLFKSLLALAVASSPNLDAQNAEASDVYELSPFSVSGADDTGYRATSTLAGTRLRTDLKDVGASVFVATKELLEDTGSTNAEDLLVYVAGAEVAGLGGNFAASEFVSGGNTTIGVTRSPQRETRIRGLASADLTREFFATDIPFDSYNTSLVTVNRGPNAVLFGLGSPAGIVDNSLLKPTYRDHTNIEFRYARFGSIRTSFDVDRVLGNGKFGIRIAGLHDDERYQQDPAFEEVNRLYGAFDYKLISNENSSTILRGHFENGSSDSNRPRTDPPGDQVSGWWLTGQPTADWLMDWRDQDRTVFSIPGGSQRQIAVVYNQPDATNPGGAGVPNAFTPLTAPDHVTAPVDPRIEAARVAGGRGTFFPSFRGIASFQDYAAGRAGSPGAYTEEQGGNFFIDRHVLDRSVFDYRNLLLDGPTKSEYYDFEAYNIAIEQILFNGNLGAEVAFDKQNFDNGYFSLYGGADRGSIAVDVNSHYPNGEINPNYGRPFVTAEGTASETENERESLRFTGFAKLNLEEKLDGRLGSILGRHTITGLYNTQSAERFGAGFYGFAPDQDYLNFKGVSNILDSNYSRARVWYYLGDSLANASSPVGANISNVRSSATVPSSIPDVLTWSIEDQMFVNRPVTFTSYFDNRLGLANGASRTRNEVDSQALIWQGHFLNDLLVGMAGWRKDEASSFTAGTPPRAEDNHVIINDPNWLIDPNAISDSEAETWTYSGVLHMPEKINNVFGNGTEISLHFSQSENFEPATPRWNLMGTALPYPAGETKDYGFTLNLFNGKFTVRTSWFETAQTNITNRQIPTGMMGNLRSFYQATLRGTNDHLPDQKAFLLANLPPQELQDFYGWQIETFGDNDPTNDVVQQSTGGRAVAGVSDRVTEGVEMEMVYNPKENWTIMFNVSQAEAKQSGIDEGADTLFKLFQPIWDGAPDLLDVQVNFRLGDVTKDVYLNPWNVVKLSDGTPVTELREWRWNLITNYKFTDDSALKGFNVGGATRWIDKPALGLPVAYSDVLDDYALDPTNPYYGSSELNVDVWTGYSRRIMNDKVDWHLKLNIRNLIGEDDLIPIAVQPDGSVINGRIPLGTIWELSSRFSF